jgi:hypothetical protein
VLALAIVILGTAGGASWALVFRTVSSPINLRAALRLYRRHDGDVSLTNATRSGLPDPGVYSYASSGSEGLSILGVHRAFPAQTTMIVTDGSCASVTWDPLEQHTEGTTVCSAPHGAYVIPQTVSHESIGGSTSTTTMNCAATLYLLPPDVQTGQRWHTTCQLEGPSEAVTVEGVALGPAALTVGGRHVTTQRVRLTVNLAGTATGTNPTEYWLDPANGLIVRELETVNVVQDGVRFTQSSDSRLTHLMPSQ